MKLFLPVVLPFCFGALASTASHAQEDNVPRDELTERKVAVSVKGATPDEYLVSLARAADVNIIADATTPSEAAPDAAVPEAAAVESPPNIPLIALLFDFSNEQRVHLRRADERTFLFWRPLRDPVKTANQIVAEHQAAMRALPQWTGKEISNAWFEYFKQQHGWTGERDATINVKIADLPSPLREGSLAAAQAKLLGIHAPSYEVFLPETWRNARLQAGPAADDGGAPHLYWVMPVRGGSVTTPIGRLDAPRRAR